MFRRTAVASVLSLVAASLASPAPAATFTPDFPPNVRITGRLTIDQGGPVTCDVTLDGYIMIGGSMMQITNGSFAAGDWQCGWLVQPTSFPWTVTPNNYGPWPTATIQGMGVNTILGNCSGFVTVKWGNGPSWNAGMDFWGQASSGSPYTCFYDGMLSVTNYSSTPITIQ